MTYAARPHEFANCPGNERPVHPPVAARRHGWLRRIYDAMFESRQKQAERAIAAYLESTGGRFTDSIERRVTERLISGKWPR
jgi:hypothetical protein